MRAIWTRLALGIATLALASGAANAACDFLTGGGFIIVNKDKANFGVAGGCKNDSNSTPDWGHLEYIDHGIGLNVHWTSITGYSQDPTSPSNTRFICGTARTNLYGDVNFVVRAKDGEPGVMDEFDITLSSMPPYSTFTTGPHQLSGGNIELHNPNRSTTGNFGPASCGPGAIA